MDRFCMKEMYDIEMCHECYLRSNTVTEWFTDVCNPPHLLVWARISGHHYYAPAKVFGLSNTTVKRIDVRFFGDYLMASILPTDCFIYSKLNPDQKSDEKNHLKLLKCLEVRVSFRKSIDIFPVSVIIYFDCLRQPSAQSSYMPVSPLLIHNSKSD